MHIDAVSRVLLAVLPLMSLACSGPDNSSSSSSPADPTRPDETSLPDATASDAASEGDAHAPTSNPPDASLHDAGAPVDARSDSVAPAAGLAHGTNSVRPLGTTPAKNGFLEYLPAGYGGSVKNPLLVFWHGVGEIGSGSAADLAKVAANGPPLLIAKNTWRAELPFVVLSPQFASKYCPTANEIHDFMAYAISAYAIDPKRVYLTALSCGALGSATYLGSYGADQVAAAVLIAGNANNAWQGKGCGLLSGMALWSFHGDADTVNPIAPDSAGMANFIACPQPRKAAKYNVYPGAGHDVWTRTYDGTAGYDVYTWMLAFTK